MTTLPTERFEFSRNTQFEDMPLSVKIIFSTFCHFIPALQSHFWNEAEVSYNTIVVESTPKQVFAHLCGACRR